MCIFHIVDTAAEWSKPYCEKNKTKVLELDALRKRLKRVEMKISNPEKNKIRLLKERLYKRDYRKRMKKHNQDRLVPSISESIEGGFSQRSTHLKFQLRIMPETNNRGRPKKELRTDEKSCLLDFLDCPNITYTTPGKRDQREIKCT